MSRLNPNTIGVFAAAAICLLLLPTSALAMRNIPPGTEGPYEGAVGAGETDLHLYATGPRWCFAPPRYVVTLTYEPAPDTLVLQAGGHAATGEGGRAEVSFDDECSTQFLITVTDASVAASADYVVTVLTGAR